MTEESASEEELSCGSLGLSYSSSPFEDDSSATDASDDDSPRGVVPYLYEPERQSGTEYDSADSSRCESQHEERLANCDW